MGSKLVRAGAHGTLNISVKKILATLCMYLFENEPLLFIAQSFLLIFRLPRVPHYNAHHVNFQHKKSIFTSPALLLCTVKKSDGSKLLWFIIYLSVKCPDSIEGIMLGM